MVLPPTFCYSNYYIVRITWSHASITLVGFEPGIESSRHLESNALTTTLSTQDPRSVGMQRVNSGLNRDKCKSTFGIRTRDIKSTRSNVESSNH